MTRLAILAAALIFAACSPAADAPSDAAAPVEAPVQAAVPAPPPPPPEAPMEIGSQTARDDLYCSALIFAANPMPDSGLNPMDEARLMKTHALALRIGDNGVNALVIAGDAHATHAGVIVDAYAAQAAADLAANAPRIALDACIARAEATPEPQ